MASGPLLRPHGLSAPARTTRVALWAGLAGVALSISIGAAALYGSQRLEAREFRSSSLRGVRSGAALVDEFTPPQLSAANLALLERVFDHTRRLPQCELVLLDERGNVLLDTHRPDRLGASWSTFEFDGAESAAGPLAAQLATGRDASGILTVDGERFEFAIAHAPRAQAWIAMVTPASSFAAAISKKALPWWIALGGISLVLLPLPLLVLHRSSRRAFAAESETRRKLEASESALRATIESLPFAVSVHDLEGRVQLQNAVSASAHATSDGRAQDGDNTNETWRASLQRAARGEIAEVELSPGERADGRSFRSVIAPVRTERGIAAVTRVDIEVTDSRRVERELRQALKRLDFHADNALIALIEWDRELRIARWSGAAERIFGWTSEEMLGKTPAETPLIRGTDIAAIEEVVARLVEHDGSHTVFQNRCRTKHGRIIHCAWHNSVLRSETGAVESIVSFVQDNTPQHHAAFVQSMQERVLERILGGSSVAEVVEEIFAFFGQVLPEARYSVLKVDEKGRSLRSFVASGLSPAYTTAVDGVGIAPGNGTCGTSAATGRRVVTTDVRTDPAWAPYLDIAKANDIRACWSQPIFSGDGRVLATIALYFEEPRGPLANEVELLETAASLVGLALVRHNASLFEETRRETMRRILEQRPLEEILSELALGVERQVPGLNAAILLRDPDGLQVRPFVRPRLGDDFMRTVDALEIGHHGGTCGLACATKERVVVHDVREDPLVAPFREQFVSAGVRAVWSQPILSASNDALGCFAMLWNEPRTPTKHEIGLIESATSLAGLAIEQFHSHVFAAIQRHVMKMILDGGRLEETLAMLVRSLERQLIGMRAAVLVSDREQRTLSAVAGPSLPREFIAALQHLDMVGGNGTWGEACRRRAPVIARDVTTDPNTLRFLPLLTSAGIRASWSIPVLAPRGDVLGTFVMFWRDPCEPGTREVSTFEFAASLAALAIEHYHAQERQQRLHDRLKALHEIGQAILSADTAEEVASAATERVLVQMPCARASVALIDMARETSELIAVATRASTAGGRGFTVALRDTLFSADPPPVASTVYVVEDFDALPALPSTAALLRAEGVRSFAYAPLIVNGEVIGTFNVGFERTGPLTKGDEDFLVEVTNMCAVALQQARLREQERHLSRRLAALAEVGRAILAAESVAGVAVAALEYVHTLVACQRASLMLFDFEANEAEIVATAVRGKTKLGSGRRIQPAELGLPGFERHLDGGVQIVADVEALAGTSSVYATLRDEGVRATTWVPVVSRGETIGVIEIGLARSGTLLQHELAFVRELADLLSLALHQAQLTDELRTRADEQRHLSDRLVALNNIGRAILGAPSLSELVDEAIARTRQSIGCERVSVALLDDDARTGQKLSLAAPAHASLSFVQSVGRFPFDDLERLRTGEPLVIEDLAACEDADEMLPLLAASGVCSALLVPLVARGQLLGVLNLAYVQRGAPHPRDVALAREIGALLAVGVAQNRLNEEIRRNAEELERRVDERTTELTEVNEELESYVRTVSHDLRAPLRAIYGLGTAVIEDNRKQLDTQGLEFLERMIAAAARMDQMLLDLLAYSRLGKAELRLDHVDVASAVAAAHDLVSGEFETSGAEFTVVEPLAPVRGHGPTLVQALSNLFTNAAKYTQPGERPRIRVWTEERGPITRICVGDEGIGIAPVHHERIYRAFERLHGPDLYPGTGIGLAIVRRAIERMGGEVGVESQLGEGSVFWIELPCSNVRT
jgi:PAS domain S-box-containing protein